MSSDFDSNSFIYTAQNNGETGEIWAQVTIAVNNIVDKVALAPNLLEGGQSSTGTVSLLNPAPAGGHVVNLSSQNPTLVGVPKSVTVPAGASTVTFPITSKVSNQSYSAVITASDADSTASATLTALDDSISSFKISPTSVVGGSSATGTVSLLKPAPAYGWTVHLRASTPSTVTVPAYFLIPAGQTSLSFTISTKATGKAYSCTITASTSYNAASQTLSVKLK